MNRDHVCYLATKFLREHQRLPVDKRLAFDVWADRLGVDFRWKRRLWLEVKSIAHPTPRRRPQAGIPGGERMSTLVV